MKPTVTLIDDLGLPFVFVIPPIDLVFSDSQNHKPIDIIDLGEVVRNGKRKAIRVTFSGFLPSVNSYFYNPILNPLGAKPSSDWLRYAMHTNKTLKLIIPEYLEFLKCKIEGFDTKYQDHTGDIYYSISLVEDREADKSTTIDLVTGLLKR